MYHPSFYRGRNRFYGSTVYNPMTDKNEKILFDVKDPSTMTRPKDVSKKWRDAQVAMANSSKYGVVTVYDNNYGAREVLDECKTEVKKMLPNVGGSWDVHTHCEWCGQALDYVAVIVGIENGSHDAWVNHIGCDCVGKIFGIHWFGYRNADGAKRKLIEAAKIRRRAVEYPVKYAKELAQLESLPEFLLTKNTFLKDMKRILRDGSRAVSKKMENYLRATLARKEYDPKSFAAAKIEIDKTLEKLDMILKMVESVDTTDELRAKPWSAYNFVKSIKDKYDTYHSPLTQKQMEALNRVYVKYRDAKVKKNTNQMKGNPNDIPW
jgi:hypothetical protein